MNFNDWMNTIPDNEKDTLCLMDAWRAGMSAMLERLIEDDWIGKEYKSMVRLEVRELMGDENEL